MDQEHQIEALFNQLQTLVEEGEKSRLAEICSNAEPHNLAMVVREFPLETMVHLFEAMATDTAAETLFHLDVSIRVGVMDGLNLDALARMVSVMEPDDAADLLPQMDEEKAAAVLELLPPEKRAPVDHLLAFEEETAGRLMDPDVVTVEEGRTVKQAVEMIRGYVEQVRLDRFYSVFVVDSENHLKGTVPVWRMLLAGPDERIIDLMDPVVSSVSAHLDQEELANLVRNHDLVVVPVVDEQNRLIGRVTVDDVVDVIEEEHQEDIGRIAGTGAEEIRELSIFQTIRLRSPWLVVALVGEFGLALVMREQEGFLARLPQLAFFIPLIMAMGGNAGVQSASLVIRGLATGEVRLTHFWHRLAREAMAAIGTGFLFGFLLILGSGFVTGQMNLGIAVGLATMSSIILAASMGTSIPMVLKRFNLDPALATGPFITTLNDIIGILVYLAIAYAVLI